MLNQALMGAVFGSGLAVPWLALSFLAWRLDVAPFLPFELTHWLIQVMPGGFITSAVEGMVGLLQGLRLGSTSLIGKTAEAWSAVLFLLAVLAVLGAMGALLAPRVVVPGLGANHFGHRCRPGQRRGRTASGRHRLRRVTGHPVRGDPGGRRRLDAGRNLPGAFAAHVGNLARQPSGGARRPSTDRARDQWHGHAANRGRSRRQRRWAPRAITAAACG